MPVAYVLNYRIVTDGRIVRSLGIRCTGRIVRSLEIRCAGRIIRSLEIRCAGRIVRSLDIRRSMLDPHWRTRDKHWESQMVYCRNIRRWVPIFRPQAQNIPSSGIRRAWGWRIVVRLEIGRGSWYVLGWPRSIGLGSILANWASVRHSCCNTPLALRYISKNYSPSCITYISPCITC